MSQNFEITARVFFFNAKTDYLPYYKEVMLDIDGQKTAVDVLAAIKEADAFFAYPSEYLALKINSKVLVQNVTVKELVEIFGVHLAIEPVSSYRAVKDLVINDEDFIQKYQLFASLCSEEDFTYYQTLLPYYYASEMLKYNQDYMGDSAILFAHYLIEKYPEQKESILAVVNSKENGIWLYEKECNLYPEKDIASVAAGLKNMLGEKNVQAEGKLVPFFHAANAVLAKAYGLDTLNAQTALVDQIGLSNIEESVKHPFSDFNIAYYAGTQTCESTVNAEAVVKAVGGQYVKFSAAEKANGYGLLEYNQETAYKKAGAILLDAYDKGAEILVVDSEEAFFMFDTKRKKCEQAVGRDIKLPVLSAAQLICLSQGLMDKKEIGLENHRVVPDFV